MGAALSWRVSTQPEAALMFLWCVAAELLGHSPVRVTMHWGSSQASASNQRAFTEALRGKPWWGATVGSLSADDTVCLELLFDPCDRDTIVFRTESSLNLWPVVDAAIRELRQGGASVTTDWEERPNPES